MKTDGIIFDIDGTLWNTTDIVAQAWNQALEKNDIHYIHITPQLLQQVFGKTMKVIGDIVFADVAEEKREVLLEACCEYEQEALHKDECNILYPNVIETIVKLQKSFRIFIVSNCQSGYIELFLEKTKLAPYITDFECYGNTERGKGENIKSIVERNGLQNPVYIGDTLGDYEACIEADVPFVYAAYGFGEVVNCELSIQKMDELLVLFNV